MGTTIVICITLILIAVVICATYTMTCISESDERELEQEVRRLKSEIWEVKQNKDEQINSSTINKIAIKIRELQGRLDKLENGKENN